MPGQKFEQTHRNNGRVTVGEQQGTVRHLQRKQSLSSRDGFVGGLAHAIEEEVDEVPVAAEIRVVLTV